MLSSWRGHSSQPVRPRGGLTGGRLRVSHGPRGRGYSNRGHTEVQSLKRQREEEEAGEELRRNTMGSRCIWADKFVSGLTPSPAALASHERTVLQSLAPDSLLEDDGNDDGYEDVPWGWGRDPTGEQDQGEDHANALAGGDSDEEKDPETVATSYGTYVETMHGLAFVSNVGKLRQ